MIVVLTYLLFELFDAEDSILNELGDAAEDCCLLSLLDDFLKFLNSMKFEYLAMLPFLVRSNSKSLDAVILKG